MNWPADFVHQMHQLLGTESDPFFQSLEAPVPISIHVNPSKPLPFQHTLERIPWNPNGFYLPTRPVFTLDPLFHAGTYYVMEASSMFLAEAVRQCVDLHQDINVLDLAAAPGGKTIVLASLLSQGSLLLSNEVINSRYNILRQNIAKWGYPNVMSSNLDAEGLQEVAGFFDLVLVDAPCSGEGLFRRDPEAAGQWSADQVTYCSARQKKILADTIQLLKPGGHLIFSTCTFNDQENEQNAQWLVDEFPMEPIPLQLPEEWGIVESGMGYQFFPHKVKGEGFYLACFRKKGETSTIKKKKGSKQSSPWQKVSKKEWPELTPWIKEAESLCAFTHERTKNICVLPQSLEERVLFLSQHIRKIHIGTNLGELKHHQLVPHADWALSNLCAADFPSVSLEEEDALLFLKKDPFPSSHIPKGWQLVKYQGYGLGWIKGLGNRINNYYPNYWRILMNIPKGPHSFWKPT